MTTPEITYRIECRLRGCVEWEEYDTDVTDPDVSLARAIGGESNYPNNADIVEWHLARKMKRRKP